MTPFKKLSNGDISEPKSFVEPWKKKQKSEPSEK